MSSEKARPGSPPAEEVDDDLALTGKEAEAANRADLKQAIEEHVFNEDTMAKIGLIAQHTSHLTSDADRHRADLTGGASDSAFITGGGIEETGPENSTGPSAAGASRDPPPVAWVQDVDEADFPAMGFEGMPLPLPCSIDVHDEMQAILGGITVPSKPSSSQNFAKRMAPTGVAMTEDAQRRFAKHFVQRHECLNILQDGFWYCYCALFKSVDLKYRAAGGLRRGRNGEEDEYIDPDNMKEVEAHGRAMEQARVDLASIEEHMEIIKGRIAANFVHLLDSVHRKRFELFLDSIDLVIARLIHSVFYHAYKESREKFRKPFQLQLIATVSSWMNGRHAKMAPSTGIGGGAGMTGSSSSKKISVGGRGAGGGSPGGKSPVVLGSGEPIGVLAQHTGPDWNDLLSKDTKGKDDDDDDDAGGGSAGGLRKGAKGGAKPGVPRPVASKVLSRSNAPNRSQNTRINLNGNSPLLATWLQSRGVPLPRKHTKRLSVASEEATVEDRIQLRKQGLAKLNEITKQYEKDCEESKDRCRGHKRHCEEETRKLTNRGKILQAGDVQEYSNYVMSLGLLSGPGGKLSKKQEALAKSGMR